MIIFSSSSTKQSGFSLIEVLIAVLVLATGMLALAALQSSLIRNSVDAKNRSQAMSIAVDSVERAREAAGLTIADYNALPVGQGSWTAWQPPAGLAGAGSSYSASYQARQNVTRFVRESNQAICGGAANTPCFRPAVAADSPQSGVAEFKRIDIEVRWTDAQGQVRTVATSDVVGSVTDDKTDSILDQSGLPTSGVGEPVARIPKPSEAGIIPIAIGDGKETAASNPKPITGRERGRTDETQFQVFTYAVEAGNVARLNRVVDTRVIGCRCTLAPAVSFVDETQVIYTPVQASIWNGEEYSEPEAVADINEGERGTFQDGASQSILCETCCLDHHDRASNAIKLDPFRTAESLHQHYYDANEGDGLNVFDRAASGDNYLEVCRMIRVNGIFRVTQDMRLDLMNMLETDPSVNDSLPLASKIPRYQAAVKEFVNQRIVGGVTDPDMSSFDDVLIDPAQVGIKQDSSRYLHNRGLYIDHLEQPALDALANALDNCPNGTDGVDCVLPVLPFVSINTTELGQWTSEIADSDVAANSVAVTNWSLAPIICPKNKPDCSPPPPARGVVSAFKAGEEGAIVKMQRSNSGVSDSYPIDDQDAGNAGFEAEVLSDLQDFLVEGACPTDPVNSFIADLLGGPDISQLGYVRWRDPAAAPAACSIESGGACSTFTTKPDVPSDFSCGVGFALPRDVVLSIGGYNRSTTAKIAKNPCTNKAPAVNENVCENWKIASVSVGSFNLPVASNVGYSSDGLVKDPTIGDGFGESAVITLPFPHLKNAGRVTVNFAADNTNPLKLHNRKPGYTCDAVTKAYTALPCN